MEGVKKDRRWKNRSIRLSPRLNSPAHRYNERLGDDSRKARMTLAGAADSDVSKSAACVDVGVELDVDGGWLKAGTCAKEGPSGEPNGRRKDVGRRDRARAAMETVSRLRRSSSATSSLGDDEPWSLAGKRRAAAAPDRIEGGKKREKGKGLVPDVPGEMLAPAKDHATFSVASALEGLCRRGTVALCRARDGWVGRRRGRRGRLEERLRKRGHGCGHGWWGMRRTTRRGGVGVEVVIVHRGLFGVH